MEPKEKSIRVTRKGQQQVSVESPKKESVFSIFHAHSTFVRAFQSYHNILEKPDSVEYKDGKSLVAALYALADAERRAVKWICAQFIEQNKLDWTINRFYNVVKSVHSREEGTPKERRVEKATYLQEAAEQARKEGKDEEQVKAALKIAAYQHKKLHYADFVRENFDLDEIIEFVVLGKIEKLPEEKRLNALDLVMARLAAYRSTKSLALPKAA